MKSTQTRQAVRALILSDANEVLLLRMKHPKRKRDFWLLPGGGINPDEDPIAALKREVWEETGMNLSVLPILIWRRTHRFKRGFGDTATTVDQREDIFLVKNQRFEPTADNNPDLSKVGDFRAFCWWSVDRLATAENELFAPRSLPRLVHRLIEKGPPANPIALTD